MDEVPPVEMFVVQHALQQNSEQESLCTVCSFFLTFTPKFLPWINPSRFGFQSA
jgi:hypothetical protein